MWDFSERVIVIVIVIVSLKINTQGRLPALLIQVIFPHVVTGSVSFFLKSIEEEYSCMNRDSERE